MSQAGQTHIDPVLAAHEGLHVYSAAEAILKGTFESDREISLIASPQCDAFEALLARSADHGAATLLRKHGTAIKATPNSQRALTLAAQATGSVRHAICMIASDELSLVTGHLGSLAMRPLKKSSGLCILIENDPNHSPAFCPRAMARSLNIPAIEAADLASLRDSIDQALRLSRAGACPAMIIAHTHLLKSWQTLEAMPNRAPGTIDTMIARRRRPRPRWTETRDLLRMARRLEINNIRAQPSPGEVVPTGFITVGPADPSLQHVLHELLLTGRVPTLQLGLIWPIDHAALLRFLQRCDQVVVLEPGPGSVEQSILSAAEVMRRAGHRIATIWGRVLPADEHGEHAALTADDAIHPSLLVRNIHHLLHGVRPGRQVATRIMPDPPQIDLKVSPRGQGYGGPAARAVLQRSLADVDQWLRNQAPLNERGLPPSALAIDGIEPETSIDRTIPVEVFKAGEFAQTGAAALRQAARDDRPWIFLILQFETHDRIDIERFARGIMPGERSDRLRLVTANLNDRFSIRDQLQEAVLTNQLTLIVVRDAPAPMHDLRAIERSLSEIDRHGFQHSQRVIRSVDHVCLFPQQQEEESIRQGRDPQSRLAMRTEMRFDRFARPSSSRFRFKVLPLLEQIEVVRSKPPAWIWRSHVSGRLELPTPIHRNHSLWRIHLAGCRGSLSGVPGVVGEVLLNAGRIMGYDVCAVHDDTPIAPGRRAWTQILFTRPQRAGRSVQVDLPSGRHGTSRMPIIPFGEADVVLGLDPAESIRAISADPALQVANDARTCAVINIGRFTEEQTGADGGESFEEHLMREAFRTMARDEHLFIADFADVCRRWFQTDRLADLAMLGVAFQRGLIPIGLDAMERALQEIEFAPEPARRSGSDSVRRYASASGFGRSREAFEFGRHLAVGSQLSATARSEDVHDSHSSSTHRELMTVRRMVRYLRRRGFGSRALAGQFERLMQRCLTSMPGLSETNAGRLALCDFVTAAYRMLEWGGFDYCSRYAELIMGMYRADRGERARAVTRDAILPLAEAMLIHDPIYVASMTTGLEQRRRLRMTLSVKNARGDRIERRYLTRVELIAFDRRFRADLRTSDWPARLARLSRHLLPISWRGTRRERDIRGFVIDLVQRASYGCQQNYDGWRDVIWRLHLHAVENRLRDMTLAELKMLTELGSDTDNDAADNAPSGIGTTTEPVGGD